MFPVRERSRKRLTYSPPYEWTIFSDLMNLARIAEFGKHRLDCNGIRACCMGEDENIFVVETFQWRSERERHVMVSSTPSPIRSLSCTF